MSKLRLICQAVIATAVVTAAASAAAQTLADPNPKPKWRPPSHAEKSHPAAAKTCAAYGAGFMQVAGTGACVKVGGFVEGTVSGR